MTDQNQLSEREKRIAAESAIMDLVAERDRLIVDLEMSRSLMSRLVSCVERISMQLEKQSALLTILTEKVVGPMPHDLANENPAETEE